MGRVGATACVKGVALRKMGGEDARRSAVWHAIGGVGAYCRSPRTSDAERRSAAALAAPLSEGGVLQTWGTTPPALPQRQDPAESFAGAVTRKVFFAFCLSKEGAWTGLPLPSPRESERVLHVFVSRLMRRVEET